jgi:NADPH:quinone reductase-like Zn-dependent oxidoreductase
VAGDDGVVVRVHAASVNAAEWHAIRGVPYLARLSLGLRRPANQIMGCDVAGRVEAVGKDITAFQPGDEVFGSPFMRGFGGFAEYVRVPADCLAHKPAGVSFEQAAAVPLAALTALQALRDRGRIAAGQRVLLAGASGGVGTFAVQLAKYFDAEVTGTCSTRNVDMVRALGADHVIDYTRDDPMQSGQRYDLVLQIAGSVSPWRWRRVLDRRGTLVQISGDASGHWIGPIGQLAAVRLLSPFVSQTMTTFTVKPNSADLQLLATLLESGRIEPVIDRTYPLPDVGEAIRHMEDNHTRGKIVITV